MLKFLIILTKWRKLFAINIFVAIIFSVFISFQIPNWYKATSIVQPNSNASGSSNLSSMLGLSSLGNLGLNFGLGGGEQTTLFAFLKSRSLATKVIREFKLMNFYERETLEETLKDFYSDFDVQPTEEGMIEISFEYTDSVMSAEIVNYIVSELGRRDIALSIEQAQQEKEIINKRYDQSLKNLDSLADELENFQKKYGVIEFTEQTKALMNAAATIEAELFSKNAQLNSVQKTFGKDHPYTKSLSTEIQSLEDELSNIKSKKTDNTESPFKTLFIPFEKIPQIGKEYTKLYSEFLLQSKLQEFLVPQLEQAKLKLSKQSPSFQIIDRAVPPDYKSKPKRSIIVIAIVALIFILSFIFVLILEHLDWMKENQKDLYSDWVNVRNKWFKISPK